MAELDIHTTADPVTTRDLTFQMFAAHGFNVNLTSDYSAIVERGSKGSTIAFGAFTGKNIRITHTMRHTGRWNIGALAARRTY